MGEIVYFAFKFCNIANIICIDRLCSLAKVSMCLVLIKKRLRFIRLKCMYAVCPNIMKMRHIV